MVDVERKEALCGRGLEFGARHAAIEVGIRGNHGFGKVEQAITASALVLVFAASEKSRASAFAPASVMASVTAAPPLSLSGASLPYEVISKCGPLEISGATTLS